MQGEGVSRTVVREAISRLQAERLVETRHGVGTFVLDLPDVAHGDISLDCNLVTLLDVMSILEFRISIESEAAGLAAQRRTPEDVAAMRAALEQFDMNNDVRSEDNVEADIAFHTAIATATGNRYFSDVLKQLGAAIIPRSRINAVRRTAQEQQEYLRQINGEHRVVLATIERQDAEAARATMRIHLSNSRERLGAHGVLLLPHYRTEASQEGIAAQVCRSIKIGVVFYNRANSRWLFPWRAVIPHRPWRLGTCYRERT